MLTCFSGLWEEAHLHAAPREQGLCSGGSVGDFHPLLPLVLHVFVGSSWDAMQSVGPGVDFNYHAHPILLDGVCSHLLPSECLEYLPGFKSNKEPSKT